jgi:hypothetical protein
VLQLRRDLTGDQRFYPAPSEPPFALAVKHGRKARFRMLVAAGLSEAPPPKSARAQQIGRHLQNALEIVAGSLVDVLRHRAETTRAAAARLRPRVTVWEPEDGYLRSINPRLELASDGAHVLAPSRTLWPLPQPGGRPTGPLAAAFLAGRAAFLHGLPDPADRADWRSPWACSASLRPGFCAWTCRIR